MNTQELKKAPKSKKLSQSSSETLPNSVRLTVDMTVLFRSDLGPLEKVLLFIFSTIEKPEELYSNPKGLAKLLKVQPNEIRKSIRKLRSDGLVVEEEQRKFRQRYKVRDGHYARLLNLHDAAMYLGMSTAQTRLLINAGGLFCYEGYVKTIDLLAWRRSTLVFKGTPPLKSPSRREECNY